MNHNITTGIGVVIAILIVMWASRWGKIAAVVAIILVVAIGGSYVAPIKQAANGVISVIQAPLSGARDAMNKKWLK